MKHMYRALLALLVTFVSLQGRGQSVSGPTQVCLGSTITLLGAPGGGTWTSAAPGIATINISTGVVTGTAAGVALITYASSLGPAYYSVTVNTVPAAISGTATVCVGSTTTLTDVTPGGAWSSSNIAVATISAPGVLTGVGIGTTNISYALPTGCYATRVVTVNPAPAAITGTLTIACGGTTSLSDVTAGGTWTSSNTAVGTVSSFTGVVSGISGGTSTISYTLSTGCSRSVVVTVSGTTSPGIISGPSFVCVGSTATLTETVSGGTWSTLLGYASVSSGGVVTGVSAGADTVIYTVSGPCGTATTYWSISVGVTPTMGSIFGPMSICAGNSSTLGCTPAGGTWSSASATVATVGAGTGIVTGATAGTTTISYTVTSSCGTGTSTAVVTVNAAPGAITGGGSLCTGATITLSNPVPGGTWSTASGAATIGASTGILSGTGSGIASVTYTAPGGCIATTSVTVNATPALSATAPAASCGPMYTGIASGATTYSWSPATGLSCATCATTNISVTTTSTYTVTGSNGTCSASATVTVNGNRIDGNIFFSSTSPSTPACKVWLVQFDPTDSSITATDSANTCLDSGIPYYEFAGKPAGSYMVKAKLLSSVAGTSDYIPTYGASTPYWYLASAISHSSTTNVQNITMAYGTVPAGPGFIGGYVVSGAGKGTTGDAPVVGMIIYLKNASTGAIITYTYTDAAGHYSFNSLSYGNYIVHPDEFDYYTTPSAVVTLNATTPGASGTSFKKYTTSHTIVPYSIPNLIAALTASDSRIYPNPANGYVTIAWGTATGATGKVVIKDLMGRTVINTTVSIDPNAPESTVNVSDLAAGVYFINVNSGNNNYTEKLIIK